MSTTDPTPVDPDDTAADGPRFTIARVIDAQHVWLRDVTGAPLVPKAHGSTSTVVETIGFTYERPAPGAPYVTERIRVSGSRAKKDGTASANNSDEVWSGPGYVRPNEHRDGRFAAAAAPDWLRELAEAYRPKQAGVTHVYSPVDRDNDAWRPPYHRR